MPPTIAICCGDPAGVGPELIRSWLETHPTAASTVTVIGPVRWTAELASTTGCAVRTAGAPDFVPEPGNPTVAGAQLAWDAMRIAAEGCCTGAFRAVVTGPVSKRWMHRAGYPYPGQTEFFAAAWGGSPTMGFVGERLRVVLATWHDPLAAVPDLLADGSRLRRAVARAGELARTLGAAEPRIAVCGLNPHAGEGGLIGTEEQRFIAPALDSLRGEWPGLSEPLPADTVFFRMLEGEFDIVAALYHDQGLTPLKTLEFDTAVNVTLGLRFPRTSPDHGTAFEIAGTGRASRTSLERAVDLADRLSTST